ncbi:hypothetical protein AMJ57_03135 [Parcubacteria bacterium SG8_24]|nr:MAG: hypothetical protein AMJ57_03135 [Parcubacteria bacterium SG8_24]
MESTLVIKLVGLLALLISLSTHEYCHALVAHLLGDDTARRMGRLTLNPIPHIDPLGTVFLPLLMVLSSSPVLFGWAKPVPFNPYNLRYRKWGPTLVALSGPASNLVGAVLYALLLRLVIQVWHFPFTNLLPIFLIAAVQINVLLAIFNFIPIPPLDGSKLLFTLLDSPKYARMRLFLETRGILLLLLVIFFAQPLLMAVFSATLNAVYLVTGL